MADARLTDEEIEAIEKRAEAATPGPWRPETDDLRPDDGGLVVSSVLGPDGSDLASINPDALLRRGVAEDRDDADFIAAARTDVPRLVKALRAEREANAKLIAVVTAARAMLDTWGEHWDCSASPGHEAMADPVSALATALDDFTPEGHGG